MTGQLDHPNIAPIYELGRDPEGEHLLHDEAGRGPARSKALLVGEPPDSTTPDQLQRRLDDRSSRCATASRSPTAAGVLHCDIKTANVMVGAYGQVFVMDWGRRSSCCRRAPAAEEALGRARPCCRCRRRRPTASVWGTPAYMSPEQAMGRRKSLDERSDVFLMGGAAVRGDDRPPALPRARRRWTRCSRWRSAAKVASPDVVRRPKVPFPPELVRIVHEGAARRPRRPLPPAWRRCSDDIKSACCAAAAASRRSAVARRRPRDPRGRDRRGGLHRAGRQAGGLQARGRATTWSLRWLGPGDVFGETADLRRLAPDRQRAGGRGRDADEDHQRPDRGGADVDEAVDGRVRAHAGGPLRRRRGPRVARMPLLAERPSAPRSRRASAPPSAAPTSVGWRERDHRHRRAARRPATTPATCTRRCWPARVRA